MNSKVDCRLQLFSVFHLNLMFSSIEEEDHGRVLRHCYHPLLELADMASVPIAIELTGLTLKTLAALDPSWLALFRRLLAEGKVELIGSGYSQIIGSLVPAEVNLANQREGLDCYERLLGIRPRLALINEQAWSSGLVGIYHQAGYQGVIMEWDNPALGHPDWPSHWRYYPQRAMGCRADETIPLLWNQSITFQKFQRYAHREIELAELVDWLATHLGNRPRGLALYGNDAEIFDFRPGRFITEAPLAKESEWERIGRLYAALAADQRFELVLPSAILALKNDCDADRPLRLESAQQPIPVKKQAKYNITRWAVTGRDDLSLNSRCWRLFTALQRAETPPDHRRWRELCYLWSSDFRTHITARRWRALQQRLRRLERSWLPPSSPTSPIAELTIPADFLLNQSSHRLTITNSLLTVVFNTRRGLALDAVTTKNSVKPLVGSLPHGYYDHISYGNDYYTGHLTLDIPGEHKLTDLEPAKADCFGDEEGRLHIRGEISTSLGILTKEWIIWPDTATLELRYHLRWPRCPKGALHLGHITLHPESFDRRSLFFATANGGFGTEIFPIGKEAINHLAPVSALTSANQGLGMTNGRIELGDDRRKLRIDLDPTAAAATGHIIFAPLGDCYFYRLVFSLQELDDTACHIHHRRCFADCHFSMRLSIVD